MDTFKECNVFSAIVPNIGNILEAANKVYNKNLDGRKKTILEYYGVELDDLGNKINYIRGVKDRYVVFYQNGDSVVFSKRTSQHLKRDPDQQLTTHNYLDKKFNNNAIKYMQYLEDIIIKSGKKALFIIEPTSYNDTFLVDVSLLKKYIKSDIVDNTNFFFGDFNFWSDKKHLNYLGRGYYTSLIKRQLLDIL